MDIRQLQYLASLAREKHFTRAAEACHVTQPTLSGRIRQLEQELGVPIVERGQRYIGLTREGERVLSWAKIILDNWQSLHRELGGLKGGDGHLQGRIVLGVVPSALPMVSQLTSVLQQQHSSIDFTILSHTSAEIIRGLNDFAIDAGITYLDNEPVEGLLHQPLYCERYALFIARDHALAQRAEIGWAEAATVPLCLLTPNMQNRRIIDKAFASVKAQPIARLETNSIINLFSSVRAMGFAAIMPDYFSRLPGTMEDVVAIPLVGPVIEHQVGLVSLNRDPTSPLIKAIYAAGAKIASS